jgi:DNA-binding FrmR family transcriptional regulator
MMADKDAVTLLLRTARGQLDGILRMVDEDRYCVDISNQLMAVSSVIKRANSEILRAHLDACVREAFDSGTEAAREEKIRELLSVLERNA